MSSTDTASDILSRESVPTSFRDFEPVGHVLVGLPTQGDVDALIEALHAAGWPPQALLHFTPKESVDELESLVDGAGPLAGFGYEITLLRRYLELARNGYRWLLVKVEGPDAAATVAQHAAACHATLAVHYRSLVVEDLL
jgi:hypothetical protein